jgi:hypothetical protein
MFRAHADRLSYQTRSTVINSKDYGITLNAALETGAVLVSDKSPLSSRSPQSRPPALQQPTPARQHGWTKEPRALARPGVGGRPDRLEPPLRFWWKRVMP